MSQSKTESFKAHVWGDVYTENIDEAKVLIKGIPFDGAACFGKGASFGPDRIRYISSIQPNIAEDGTYLEDFYVKDEGDFEIDLITERWYKNIEKEVTEMMKNDKFCLFIGGDHSVAIPLLRSFSNANEGKKIGVIHFDSHPDLVNEWQGSNLSHASTAIRAIETANINGEDYSFVGIRCWLHEEVKPVKDHNMLVIPAREVWDRGIKEVIKQLIAKYSVYDKVYITLDIDVLDPAFAPGTGTPEGGGLSTREMMTAIRELIINLPVQAMDLVEVSPPLDSSDMTTWAAVKIIYSAFEGLYKRNM